MKRGDPTAEGMWNVDFAVHCYCVPLHTCVQDMNLCSCANEWIKN